MKRYYIFKDGTLQGSAAAYESAIAMVRAYQKQETHPILKAEFSIIYGEEQIIPYKEGGNNE